MARGGIELATVYLSVALSGENLASQVGRQLGGIDRTAADAGRRAGRALASGMNDAQPNLSRFRAELDKTKASADQAAREVGAAMHRQEQATLLVTQRQKELAATVAKYGAESSQVTSKQRQLADAEFKLGIEQQKVKVATDSARQASERHTAAQKALADAEKRTGEEAKTAAGGLGRIRDAIDKVDTRKLTEGLQKVDWNGIQRGSTIVATGIGAAFAGATKTAADFESRMSAVKAVSGATAPELQQLHDKALQLGKDTAFSASESATAIEELVKAGVTVPQVMAGAADATVALAAASGIDMPEAATIASNAMNAFNIEASKMGRVADLIAGAANASAIDVGEFGQSLQMSGAVAHLAGMNFDDLAVAIAEMGNAGIKGSDAGTSLKTMLNNLQPSTKAAFEEMSRLGLIAFDSQQALQKMAALGIKPMGPGYDQVRQAISKYLERTQGLKQDTKEMGDAVTKFMTQNGGLQNQFYDQAGNLKSLREVQDLLAKSTSGLTAQQKQQALEVMFGSDAIRAAAVMASNGAAGYDELAGAMGKVTAAQTAADRMGNLNGQIEQMKGSIETLAITVGERLIPHVNAAVQRITGLVNAFLALPPDEQQRWIRLAQVIGGVAGALAISIKVAQGIGAVVKAYEGLSAAVSVVRDLSGALRGVEAASGAAKTLQDTAGAMKAVEAAKGAGTAVNAAAGAQTAAATAAGSLGSKLGGLLAPLGRVGGLFQGLFAVLSKHPIGWIVLAVIALIAGLVLAYNKIGWFRDAVNRTWAQIREALRPVTDFLVSAWRAALDWLQAKWQQWGPTIIAILQKVIGWIGTGLVGLVRGVVLVIQGIVAAVQFVFGLIETFVITPLVAIWNFLSPWVQRVMAVFMAWANWVGSVFRVAWMVLVVIFEIVWKLISIAAKAFWDGLVGLFFGTLQFLQAVWGVAWAVIRFLVVDPLLAAWRGLQEAWRWITDAFWASVNWVRSVFALAWAVIRLLVVDPLLAAWRGLQETWRWITDVFWAAWGWVDRTFRAVWAQVWPLIETPVRLARDALSWIWDRIRDIFSAAWGWLTGVFRPLWEQARALLEGPINAAKEAIGRAIDAIKDAFRLGMDAIKATWDRLGDIAKTPVRFVINTVVNEGLIDNLNKLADAVGVKDRVPRMPLPPGFRTGGYTGDVPEDQIVGPVHGREYVFDAPTVRAAGGPAQMEVLRTALRSGSWPVGPTVAIPGVSQQEPPTASGIPDVPGLPTDVRKVVLAGPQPGDDGIGGPVDWGMAQQGLMGWYRKCLAFVNAAWGYRVPRFRLATARNSADAGPRVMGGMPPAGSGVFWDTGWAGHIALAVGDGTVLSNDIRVPGRIDRVPQQEINKWGPYLGWWHPTNAAPGSMDFDPGAGGEVAQSPLQKLLGAFSSPMKWIANLAGKVIDKATGPLGNSMLAKVALGVPRFIVDKIAQLPSLFGVSDAGGGETSGLTATGSIAENAGQLMRAGKASGTGSAAMLIALITAMQESSMGTNRTAMTKINADGDVGWFQQRATRGDGTIAQLADAAYSLRVFLNGVRVPAGYHVPGLYNIRGWETMAPNDAAQRVQVSAYPYAYGRHIPAVRDLMSRFGYWIGTNFASPGIARVAEFEPELVTGRDGAELITGPQVRAFGGGEQVHNGRDLRELMGGQSQPVAEIHVHTNDPMEAAYAVSRELEWMGR